MLTQERLKELLHYDPETGIFTWIKFSASHRIKVGQIAGTPDHKGYLRIQIDNKSYRCSRLAWMYVHGVWPYHQIDHINRINTDNRISNLRDVTSLENNLNRACVDVDRVLYRHYGPKRQRLKQHNYYAKHPSGKYQVVIKRKYYGLYATEEEARAKVSELRQSLL